MAPLSILDLARITNTTNARIALDNARALALHAEKLDYKRFWVAEHHNFPGVASAATAIVVSHIAAGTTSIRVGAGGIMLPNHSPYVIAEQFGTLAHLYPGRIDLGLGRAPGTDLKTLKALRTKATSAESFPRDVLELKHFLAPDRGGGEVLAIPGVGTRVPLWILGSSTFGAKLAADLGLPFAFASHFAPQQLLHALEVYREYFKPSEELERPHAMVGVNVIAAPTEAEARRLWTTQQMAFVDMFRGVYRESQPPIDDIETYWTQAEKFQALHMLSRSIVGDVDGVGRGLRDLVRETGADEVMVVSDVYDHEARLRSLELIRKSYL